jgi:hypothetical protein
VNHTTKVKATETGTQGKIAVKPYKFKELASIYGISTKTFRRWLEPIKKEVGPLRGHFFTTNQVKVIFEKLCPPFTIDNE